MKIYIWLTGCNKFSPQLYDVVNEAEFQDFYKRIGCPELLDNVLELECVSSKKCHVTFDLWKELYREHAYPVKCCPYVIQFICVDRAVSLGEMQKAVQTP